MTPRRTSYIKVGGKGRPNAAKPVREVESVACPAGGTHVLVNDGQARTACTKCRAPWWALDELARQPVDVREIVAELLVEGAS